jgi:hypothetical protein
MTHFTKPIHGRHCEQSEAIQRAASAADAHYTDGAKGLDCFGLKGLAMTEYKGTI